jgi:broad specificity phosphatase PhoE
MRNQYYIIRHGYYLGNTKNIASCWPEKSLLPLTKKGKQEIKEVAKKIKNKKIDLIFSSDLLRTKQTAEIIGKELGIKPKTDKRLREDNVGIFNGKLIDEIGRFWDKERKLSPLEYYKKRFQIAPPQGETYADIEERLSNFIKETEKRYKGKNILVVGHQRPLTLLEKVTYNHSFKKFVRIILEKKEIKTGELRKLKLK